MNWKPWLPGLKQAGHLLMLFSFLFALLALLDSIYNTITLLSVMSSAKFIFTLYMFMAVPIIVGLRLIHTKKPWLAWVWIGVVGVVLSLWATGFCMGWPLVSSIMVCGAFDSLTFGAYISGIVILVVTMVVVTLVERRKRL
ncbi:hypothetical protein GOV11_05035 [Candidatus Woesearchaeota archaeon]|nr:hypothetical protein [Candidatus Woesearchaeota archaeon]